jgi:hypothetical protein
MVGTPMEFGNLRLQMAKNATEYGFQFKGKQNGFLIIKNQ